MWLGCPNQALVWRWGEDKKERQNAGGTPIVNYSLVKHACYWNSWSQLSEQPMIFSPTKLHSITAVALYRSIDKSICYFPQASFILEMVCFTWRMLNFASFPRSLFSVVLIGISYTEICLNTLQTVGKLDGLDARQEIYCWILKSQHLRWLLQPPRPSVLAETLKCPGGIYCI